MTGILVIEDSPSIALLLRRRLEMAGHSVDVAANGHDALDRLDPDQLPDIVLADVSMPGINGIETLRRIKSRHPGLPGILVTAVRLPPEDRAAADAVITKPIDFEQLLETIDQLTRN